MIITVAKVSSHFEPSVRTLVSNPDHQISFAPNVLNKSILNGQILPGSVIASVARGQFDGQTVYGNLGMVGAHPSLLTGQTPPANPGPGASEGGSGPSKEDVERLYTVVNKALWPIAKESFDLSNNTIEGVEIVFAGQKLWSRLTSDKGMDKVQVAIAATDFGLELYDLVAKVYPGIQVAAPTRTLVGLLVKGTDVTYAMYFTKGK